VLPSVFDQNHKAARSYPFSSLTSKTRRFDEGRLFNGDLIAETPGPGETILMALGDKAGTSRYV